MPLVSTRSLIAIGSPWSGPTGIALAQGRVGPVGLCAGFVGHQGDDRVDLGVDAFDLPRCASSRSRERTSPRAHESRQIGGALEAQLVRPGRCRRLSPASPPRRGRRSPQPRLLPRGAKPRGGRRSCEASSIIVLPPGFKGERGSRRRAGTGGRPPRSWRAPMPSSAGRGRGRRSRPREPRCTAHPASRAERRPRATSPR